MGTRVGPWTWVCNSCKLMCQCLCPSECLCPQDPDSLKVEEVTADDYINQKKKKRTARLREDNMVKSTLRSCGGFISGMLLTVAYAGIVLFVKNYNLWYCIMSSVVIGGLLCLGMAFSIKVRITVLLMIPQLFSVEGKTIVLLVAFTLTLQGPVANTLENFRRSSESISCGVELAINQTKDLLEKSKRPLVSALNSLKDIGKKLKGVANRARKFFKTVMDGVKHIGHTLRNVWRFISNIGEVCNEELEAPYLKCIKIFDDARDNCFKVMSFLSFLCYIVDAFRPLCGLAKTIVILCLLPNYVQRFVKKYAKNPIINVLRNIKDKFAFNVTVIHDFDVTLNASKSMKQVADGIMKEVQASLNPFLDVLSMFSYSMTFVCLFIFIMAVRYRRKYLYDDNHDNIYITRTFIELDVMRARQGRNTLLPLSTREAYNFIRPGSFYLTKREKTGYTFDIINVFRNVLLVIFLVLVDYIIFWVLDMVRYLLQGDLVARAPVMYSVAVNGSGYTSEIFSSVVSAFDTLQRGNLTVLSKKCLVQPSEPDFRGYMVIGMMYGLAFFISIFGVYVQRLQRSICAHYYPSREQERICFLYNNLITKRTNVESALMKNVRMNAEDEGHSSILLVLATKLPGCRWFAQLLGASHQYCMACAKVITTSSGQDYIPCITNGCKGLYCRGCFDILDNVCTICMAPLAYKEAMEEEIDSSDEEKVHIWIEAMKAMKDKEKAKKKKMKTFLKARLKEIARTYGHGGIRSRKLLEKYRANIKEEGSGSSGLSDSETSQDSGETDFEYQNKSEASDDLSDQENQPVPAFLNSSKRDDLVSPKTLSQLANKEARRRQRAYKRRGREKK
ncbi:DC-STAMP domain-containing protein 2 [Pelodytes ibericus]